MTEGKFHAEQVRAWRRLSELVRAGKPLGEALDAHIQEVDEGD